MPARSLSLAAPSPHQGWPYRAPRWLGGGGAAGGHLQTVVPVLLEQRRRPPRPPLRRERWTTPDGDFVDAMLGLEGLAPNAPCVVLFHGLEGSMNSPYAGAFAREAARRGLGFVLPHFRGCSGELNRLPRAYHCGDHAEVGWMLAQVRARHAGPLLAVGVSLGGSALLNWTARAEPHAPTSHGVAAVAAISVPLDLSRCGLVIDRGLARLLYAQRFLSTLVPKARALEARHPGVLDVGRLHRVRTMREFDDAVTAPLHGFRGVDDYWERASVRTHLHAIRLPTLLLNARNDPIVPPAALPAVAELSGATTVWRPATGGHVGFPRGAASHPPDAMPRAVIDHLLRGLLGEFTPANELDHGYFAA